MEKVTEKDLRDLKIALKRYDKDGRVGKYGNWVIASGGYDLLHQISYKQEPVIDIVRGGYDKDGNHNWSKATIERNVTSLSPDGFYYPVEKVIMETFPECVRQIDKDFVDDREWQWISDKSTSLRYGNFEESYKMYRDSSIEYGHFPDDNRFMVEVVKAFGADNAKLTQAAQVVSSLSPKAENDFGYGMKLLQEVKQSEEYNEALAKEKKPEKTKSEAR